MRSTRRSPWKAAALGAVVLTSIAIPTHMSAGEAAAQTVTPGQVTQQINASLDRVAARTGIGVDPTIRAELIANAQLFSGNFCFNPAPGETDHCVATLGTPNVLDGILAELLQEMVKLTPGVRSLADRLAGARGQGMGVVGWPSTMENRAAVIAVPATLRAEMLYRHSATGPQPLGRGLRLILVTPGRVTVTVNGADAKPVGFSAAPELRQQVALASASAGTVIGRAEVPDIWCNPPRALTYEGPLAVFNWWRSRYAESEEVRSANLRPFVTQSALDIRIVDEAGGSCGSNCSLTIGLSFARAIALWRSGCDRCGGNAFVTIRVAGHVWIDSRAADRLRRVAADSLAADRLDLSKKIPGEMQTQSIAMPFAISAVRADYADLSGDPMLLAALCRLPSDAAPWTDGAQALSCPNGSGASGPLRPSLIIRNADTACGAAIDYLACGLPGGNIQLALEGTRYRFAGPSGAVTLGDASAELKIDGLSVVVHEVGHWFGIPHTVPARGGLPDLMSETFDPRHACVSYGDMVMINNAADNRWPYAITGKMGLRRPR